MDSTTMNKQLNFESSSPLTVWQFLWNTKLLTGDIWTFAPSGNNQSFEMSPHMTYGSICPLTLYCGLWRSKAIVKGKGTDAPICHVGVHLKALVIARRCACPNATSQQLKSFKKIVTTWLGSPVVSCGDHRLERLVTNNVNINRWNTQ